MHRSVRDRTSNREIEDLRRLLSFTADPEPLLYEAQQRMSRVNNNIIVSGLLENNLGTVKERYQHDIVEFRRVLNFLEIFWNFLEMSDDSICECTAP